MRLREAGEPADAETAAELSPLGTKESETEQRERLNAIRTTPITSRLICEWGEAARRASPRLAEVVTAMTRDASIGNQSFQTRGGDGA